MTMTDAKHTPGPWEVVPSIPEEGYNCFWLKGPNGENLADISGYQSDQTKQANAQLIARAPDLLAENEALKARIAELEKAIDEDYEPMVDWLQQEEDRLSKELSEVSSDAIKAKISTNIASDLHDKATARIAELEAEKKWLLVEKERLLNAIDPTGQLRREYQFQDSSYGPTTKIREKG